MRGFLLSMALYALVPGTVQGTEPEGGVGKMERLDSAVVLTSRAGRNTPVTYTMVSKDELRKTNPLSSLPMMLNLQPSVVAVNEGGTGLGYSKMTVRGSKGSQINVTLNGITLNDAESQEVFWVNIPALNNILSSVQLQRGLGTSANGAGAFGASINMGTASVGADPYGSVDIGYGSYNTFTATVAAGTGLMRSGLYFDFAYSRGITDGYLRNAHADVQSAFAVLGWMKGSNSLRLTWLLGDQRTGITWHGVDPSFNTDPEKRRYNPAGEHYDQYGNTLYYDDTDNYTQSHLQLNYTHQFGENLIWTTTLNWTRGDGYYEQYKAGKKFSKYNFPEDFSYTRYGGNNVVLGSWTAGSYSDFITKEAMKNDYYVINSDVRYKTERLNLTAGINLSRYDGDHIGKLLWNQALGEDYDYDSHYWYLNNGLKQEANVFARAEYMPLDWLTAYVDLQYRGVSLDMKGPEDDGSLLDYSTTWNFFNPRAGLTFAWSPRSKAYVSAAWGNREPGRSDIKEVIMSRNYGERLDLKPEKMLDVELGYTYTSERFAASANIYLMEYWDMLLETGKLSDVGYAIKENVGRSFRRGIELAAGWQAARWLRADANLTLSMNRIKNLTAYLDNICYTEDGEMDWPGGQTKFEFGETTMLMSPSVTGMLQLAFTPFRDIVSNSLKTTTLSVNGKYVGKMYLDNMENDASSIPAYFVSNLSLSHEFRLSRKAGQVEDGSALGIALYVNNLFNNLYYADGWAWNVYNVDTKSVESYPGIYPQAPLNFMLKVSYRF